MQQIFHNIIYEKCDTLKGLMAFIDFKVEEYYLICVEYYLFQ